MKCEYSELISQLIDEELSVEQTGRMRKHVTDCGICRMVEQDLLGMRDRIRAFEFDADNVSQRQALWKVLSSQKVPLWRREISLPAPVFAIAALALLAFGTWSLFERSPQPRQTDQRIRAVQQASSNKDSSVMDFSRFDRGERAVVYKERRPDAAGPQGGTR